MINKIMKQNLIASFSESSAQKYLKDHKNFEISQEVTLILQNSINKTSFLTYYHYTIVI